MEIKNWAVSGTMSAFFLMGGTASFADTYVEQMQTIEQAEAALPTHYSIHLELQPSSNVAKSWQVSLSPEHMMNILNSGTHNLLAALQSRSVVLPADIKQAEDSLSELSKSLRVSLSAFSSDTDYPEPYLQENSPTELVAELRRIESIIERAQSDVSATDYLALRKMFAQARSLATRTQTMIDQRLVEPEIFKGRASPEGLKALADMATERLHSMAG